MIWQLSHRADRAALPLADRHYNRQKVGSPQFVPPGRCIVLLSRCERALWVTSWPFAEYVRHEWAGAWVNSLFRNEGAGLSSELIQEAVSVTRHFWGDGPEPHGIITFVDAGEIRSTNPGYCYTRAGWKHIGFSKGGLKAFGQAPAEMPAAERPYSPQTEFAFA